MCDNPGTAMAGIVQRNIHALLERGRSEENRRTPQQRLADAITRFTGSMRFVYIHLVLFGLWILVNLPWSPLPKFDPLYVVRGVFASVKAFFISTFVLIPQTRMAAQ